MTDHKPWFMSKAIMASLASIICTTALYFRLPVDSAAVETTLTAIAVVITNLVAIWGRVKAVSVIEKD